MLKKKLKKFIRKIKHIILLNKKKTLELNIQHINQIRNNDYRIFYANSYFSIDLEKEIKWHERHIELLEDQREDPSLFHSQFRANIEKHHHKHFKEQVIDSIPFHEKIKKQNEDKLKVILQFMNKSKYKKLVKITQKYHTSPEYFIYDKKKKSFFFIVEKLNKDKIHWIHEVQIEKRICPIVQLK